MRRKKIKWIFTAAAILLAILLGSVIPDDDLSERAIAVGFGIDLDERGEVVVSAQILSASDSGDSGVGTRVVTAQGKLLDTAVSNITETCGKTLTVPHCNVVLLGKTLIERGMTFPVLMTLLTNTYISDNAYIFACDGSPEDVFLSQSAFGQNASQYLQQLISMYGTYENITYKTLREIIVDSYNIGKATYMPYLTKKPVDPKIPPSTSYEEIKDKSDYSFDLNHVAVLKDSVLQGVYGNDALRAINYLLTEVDKGSDDFDVKSGKVGVFVLDNAIKRQYDKGNKTFSVKLEIGVTVKDFQPSDGKSFAGPYGYQLQGDDKSACETTLKNEIVGFFLEMQQKDVDVFAVRQNFYSRFGPSALRIPLSDIKFDLQVQLKVKK